MAVPFINILAPSMGGIGPVELADIPKLSRLDNGVPFYAGRFYPKKTDDAWLNGLDFGLISKTPPWLTWDEIKEDTSIWMVSGGEGETILSTNTSIMRIDVWPREPDPTDPATLPFWENTLYDTHRQNEGWGHAQLFNDSIRSSIDPGVTITQNALGSNLVTLGAVGISTVKGMFTEYAFYDQELIYMNRQDLGQPEMVVPEGKDPKTYTEVYRVRADGYWKLEDADLTGEGTFELPTNDVGYPPLPYKYMDITIDPTYADYSDWVNDDHNVLGVIKDNEQVNVYLNKNWDELTKWTMDETGSNVVIGGSKAPMGQVLQLVPSKIDTVVFTIKVAVETLVLNSVGFSVTDLGGMADYAKANFADNALSNIWYFYLPVKLNASMFVKRKELLLNRQGIRKRDNPTAVAI